MLLGVDVSHFQGTVNWARAEAAGVAFGFAKATESTNFTDPKYVSNIAGMRSAGVVPGAYHFLRPANPSGQAEHFVHSTTADVIHALDVEASGLDVAGWVRQYRKHYPKKTLLIYTGRDLWDRAVGRVNGSGFGPLWAAGYVPNRYLPGGSLAKVAATVGSHRGGVPFAGWTSALFLQFTDAATVPGIPSPCDGDIFYGTPEELQALTAEGGAQQEAPDMDPITLNSASRVGAANAPSPGRYALNDVIPAGFVNDWSYLRQEQLYAELLATKALVSAQATQLATIAAAVTALAAGSAADVQAAFAAGTAELEDQLAQLRITSTSDTPPA